MFLIKYKYNYTIHKSFLAEVKEEISLSECSQLATIFPQVSGEPGADLQVWRQSRKAQTTLTVHPGY